MGTASDFHFCPMACGNSYPHLQHILPRNTPSITPSVHLIKKAQAAVSSEKEFFPEPRNTEEWDGPSEFLHHLERQRSHAYLHFLKNVIYFQLRKKQIIQETQFYLAKISDN